MNKRRFLGILLSLALGLALGLAPGVSMTARAEGAADKTIVGLVTYGIDNPITGPGSWSKVYFGSILFNVLKNGEVVFTDFNNPTLLLDSTYILEERVFDGSGYNDYSRPFPGSEYSWTSNPDTSQLWFQSDLRAYLNGEFLNARFSPVEQAAIAESTKNSKSSTDGDGRPSSTGTFIAGVGTPGPLDWQSLYQDKIFLLDAMEVTNTSYGFANSQNNESTRIKRFEGDKYGYIYFLRSPSTSDITWVGAMLTGGSISSYPASRDRVGVSPALNVLKKSILFTTQVADKTYKLTLRDTARTVSLNNGTPIRSTTKIAVPYMKDSGSDHVSLLMTDTNVDWYNGCWNYNAPSRYYSTVAVSEDTGTVVFDLPEDITATINNYHVYLLAEKINGGNNTDYGSTPLDIRFAIQKHTHQWSYATGTGEDANTITATCTDGTCPDQAVVTIALNAPTELTYRGSALAASVSGYPARAFEDLAAAPDIVYYASQGEGSTQESGAALPSAPVDAGHYVAKITWGDQTASVAYTIAQRTITASVQNSTKTYDGTEQSGNAVYSFANLVSGHRATIDYTPAKGTFPGTYDDGAYGTDLQVMAGETDVTANYALQTTTPGKLTINKANRAITITAASDTWTYNGQPHANSEVTVTAGSLFDGDALEATATGSVTDVADTAEGNNPVAEDFKVMHGETDVTENYSITTVAGTLTINKARAISRPPTAKALTYDGTEQELVTAGSVTGGTMQYALTTDANEVPEESAFSTDIPKGTDAGDYIVWYIMIADDNHTENPGLFSVDAAIAPAPVTLTANSGEATYDGTEKTVTGFTSSVDGLTFTGVSASGSGTDAGSYPVTFTGVTENETKDSTGNYVVTSTVDGTLTVNKAEVTAPAVEGKTYTGDHQTADVVDTAQYTVTKNDGGTDVGSYEVVLTLNDPANYKWSDSEEAAITLAFNITRASAPDVPIPILDAVTYDPTMTLADITLPDGWAWVTDSIVPTVGNSGYDAALTVDDANYDYTGVEGYSETDHAVTETLALTVNKAAPTVTAPTANTLTYSGQAQALVTAGSTTGGTLYYAMTTWNEAPMDDDYALSIPTAIDAGTYYVWYKVVGDENHSDAAGQNCVAVNIDPAPVTLTAKSGSETYDGTKKGVIGYTCSVEGLNFEGVLAFGDGTDAGVYGVTFTGVTLNETLDTTRNYVVASTVDGTLTVEKAPSVPGTIAVMGLTYTGEAMELLQAGAATGGEMQYALGTETEATEPYAASIPTAINAGTYYVWYKVVGDKNHSDTEAECVTVTIDAAEAEPTIAGHTLRFGGVLGLNYYLELPEDFDGTGASMAFTIEGNTQTVPFSEATAETMNGKAYRVFPCNVHAYQMAENIAAVFSYGDGQSVSMEYSVKQYLDGITEGQYSGNAKALVTASRAYGHFIQPYLHDVNGTSHATMDYADTVDVDEAKTCAADYAMQCDTLNGDYIASAQYFLTLNASTTLNVQVTVQDGEAEQLSFFLDGKAYTPAVSGTTYTFSVPNIAANNLGVPHTVTVKAGDTTVFSLRASCVSFVNTVLSKSNPTTNELNAMAAMYHYYDAAKAYQTNPNQ